MKNGLISLFLIWSASSFAGDAVGHGGGTLARLLSYAKDEISRTIPLLRPETMRFPSAKLTRWYVGAFETMSKEIKNIQLTPSSEKITDSYFGYKTWIRLLRGRDFIVEYNPDVDLYHRLVGDINFRYRESHFNTSVSPSITDVSEYLLHEVGHRYGLDEPDAWQFAQTVVGHFSFRQPLRPASCEFLVRNRGTYKSVFSKTFTFNSEGEQQFKVNGYSFNFLRYQTTFEFNLSVYGPGPQFECIYFAVLPADTLPYIGAILNQSDEMQLVCH